MEGQVKSLIILNFHHVTDSDASEGLLSVQKQVFEQHLQIIRESTVPVISLAKLCEENLESKFAIALTIDDGSASDYEIVRPLLQQEQLPATFFPIVDQVGQNGKMNWAQIKQLHANGFEIGSHGLSHDILTRMSPEKQHEELSTSRKKMEEQLGASCESFAFPYGRFDNDLLEKAAAAGYKRVYTTGLKINTVCNKDLLYYRWNITNKTQPDLLGQVLNSRGQLSPALEVHTRLKDIAKRMLGGN